MPVAGSQPPSGTRPLYASGGISASLTGSHGYTTVRSDGGFGSTWLEHIDRGLPGLGFTSPATSTWVQGMLDCSDILLS
jgi:hypothetical protein